MSTYHFPLSCLPPSPEPAQTIAVCSDLLVLPAGGWHFFSKSPESKYFQTCEPYDVLQLLRPATVASEQLKTATEYIEVNMCVCVLIKLYLHNR